MRIAKVGILFPPAAIPRAPSLRGPNGAAGATTLARLAPWSDTDVAVGTGVPTHGARVRTIETD